MCANLRAILPVFLLLGLGLSVHAQTHDIAAQPKTRTNPKDGLTYVWIPAGTFRMGCSPGDSKCSYYEEPAHSVTITKGFWMGRTPVTQAGYKKVTGVNHSHFIGDQLPEDSVTWYEAQAYCKHVDMRLPTEAEWEYAARGGNPASRYGSVAEIAWYRANSGGTTHRVALKKPNDYGLYDMLGNVDEWVADAYGLYQDTQSTTRTESPYSLTPDERILLGIDSAQPHDDSSQRHDNDAGGAADPASPASLTPDERALLGVDSSQPQDRDGRGVVDPQGPPSTGDSYVVRGASWDNDSYFVSVSNRMRFEPDKEHQNVGFRCAAN